MRVPASMKAGVQLSGSSVEVSPDIKLHDGQQESTDTNTTVAGELNIYLYKHSSDILRLTLSYLVILLSKLKFESN